MKRREMLKYAALGSGAVLLTPYSNLLGLNLPTVAFTRQDFGDEFKWGVATAAYQIEGAWNKDGKGPSVWDTFTHTKGKVKNGETGDVACNFYEHYEQDIALIKEMNLGVFRFSIAWSRVIPDGDGKINDVGINFYHRVIDACIEQGIEPWITLYHWDLPQALEDKGGWTNRKVVDWFSYYADLMTKEYGDKVKNWMVLNEPMAYTSLGYMVGVHAPGKRSLKKYMASIHHTVLCQAEGGRIIRRNVADAHIGTTFSCSHIDVKSAKKKHETAAKTMDAMINRLFIEPVLGLGYPMKEAKILKRLKPFIKEGDEEKMKFDFDFIGIQNYSRMVARHSLFPPLVWANQVKPEKRGIGEEEVTEMGWEVYPEGMYKVLKQFAAYEKVDKIIVTENGAAFPDKVEDGKIHDVKRRKFIQDYLKNVLKAKNDGVNVQGYFAWTLMDNFEWAEGYHTRFGLLHIDFETQKRTIKDTGLWFQSFLAK